MHDTLLWQQTLDSGTASSSSHPAIHRLRNSIISMRDRVGVLISNIPQECKGLTVHDLSHLDALWETASLLAGTNLNLNPAEAYVFGAAILLHDAGMGTSSYCDGLEGIKRSPEWNDIVSHILRRSELGDHQSYDAGAPGDLPPWVTDQALFLYLRTMHARQARHLIEMKWDVPGLGSQICLIDDADLRQFYGESIGRIAESHHWDILQLQKELRTTVGAAPPFPSEWVVNEVKVACLLRCADAAHIDHRRAPSMLYAITMPKGVSRQHWSFQNRLSKAALSSGRLLYTSHSDFTPDEADSWWLCYDTISMIDREIHAANSILIDVDAAPLQVTGVLGAGDPAQLSKHIRAAGWVPVDTEIRVSDPKQLARTLGGRNLYADNFAPLRELIQNAVDAIRMRIGAEERQTPWGRITIALEEDPHDEGFFLIHVDDNGVGMSQRVMTGPLVDFGRSIWNSTILQDEYPGLGSKDIKGIGKFGIGFFSVFMISENVRVVSKRFDEGIGEARALEFRGLASRAFLRPAHKHELPIDVSTRVSLKVSRTYLNRTAPHEDASDPYSYRGVGRLRGKGAANLAESIIKAVASLNIEVHFRNEIESPLCSLS